MLVGKLRVSRALKIFLKYFKALKDLSLYVKKQSEGSKGFLNVFEVC